ncbi:hypothetical protein [Arthrobacter sp. 2MCAF14]|uniref:hypothetical protein n=1 Tax=Arthrobacter sp. 2MCAF14 TaxID=3232982 RepID=UPI003F933D7E
MAILPGTWREPHRDVEIHFPQAIEEWAEASVPVLEEVARTYGACITYKDLASRLFDATGIHTRMLVQNLSARLLNRVIRICLDRDLPALSSLVVHATDGMVGSGFDEVLRAAGRVLPGTELERERAAAAERLTCYRAYCPEVPADAVAQLTPTYEARINPVKKDAPRPKPVCVVHGIQLPATGVCDDCV